MAGCAYKPALLNKRLTIQTLARFPDGQGGFLETWNDTTTVWAEVKAIRGYERMQAMQLASPVTHKVMIRFRKGLTTAQRLVYGLQVFEIKEVIPLDKSWMQLTCVEGEVLVRDDPDWNQAGLPWERIDSPWGFDSGVAWEAFGQPWDKIGTAWAKADDAMTTTWDSLASGWDGIGDEWTPTGSVDGIETAWSALNTNWESIG